MADKPRIERIYRMGALKVCERAHPLNPFNPWLINSSSETRLKSLSVRSRAAVYNYGQVWSLIPMARATITITIIMQVAA